MKKTLQRLMAFAMVFVTILSMSVSALAYQTKSSNFNTSYTLTGDSASDLATVAAKQVGKTTSNLGYTEKWCADFVLDCARLAKISTSVIPYKTSSCADCTKFYNAMKNSCGATKVSTPKKGDLVFYYCSTCKRYVHVGIVFSSSYLVEGNLDSKVCKYKLTTNYKDSKGHTTSSGTVKRYYLRPNYSGSSSSSSTSSTTTKINISESSVAVYVGSTTKLSCNKSSGVTWSSSNKKVATVSSSGTVTAKKPGTVTITATCNGKSDTCKVTVKPKVSSTKITLSASSAKLTVGKTKQLSYTLTPSNSTDSVTWKSSNTSVATVSSSGKVTAKKAGTATITATTTSGKQATFKVTVIGIYFKACASKYTSIVDALKSIGAQSSYSYRAKIAAVNGISNYTGTATQNTKMLNLLKQGKLIKP